MRLTTSPSRRLPDHTTGLWFFFEDETEPALVESLEIHGARLDRLKGAGHFQGKRKEVLGYPTDHGVVALCGLGKRADFTAEYLRESAGLAGRMLAGHKLAKLSVSLPSAVFEVLGAHAAARAFTEALAMGQYRNREFKTAPAEPFGACSDLAFMGVAKAQAAEVLAGAKLGRQLAEAVNQVRVWTVRPCNKFTAPIFADEVVAYCKGPKLSATYLGLKELQRLKMESFLGVNLGSPTEPRLIIAQYKGGKAKDAPVVLIGKGIMFDTGGYSLKLAEGLWLMKDDMAGAAAVFGAIKAASDARLPINVVAIGVCTDNCVDAKAQKPGDIVTSMSGRTIEVRNTDAEGRLVLVDALTYAARYKPACVIDIATLTGGVVVSLGKSAMGVFVNHPCMRAKVLEASKSSGEKAWHLPLFEEYYEEMKSDIADWSNLGKTKERAQAPCAAAFLEVWAHEYRWAHLDIAGVCWQPTDQPYSPAGPTGVGVRLLYDFLEQYDGKFIDE